MEKSWSRRLFMAILCCAGIAGAEPTRCDVCGKRLPRQAWTYDGHTLCSEACVDQLRPVCSVCGAVIRGGYTEADGKIYCSTACLQTTLPKCEICGEPIETGFTMARHRYCAHCVETQPTCFSCGLPAAHPTQLQDGREICSACMRWAVTKQEPAQRHYERARLQLEAWTGLSLATIPELVLVDRDEMQRLSKQIRKTDTPVSIRGLYSRQVLVTQRGLFGAWKEEPDHALEKIYIVDHLSDEVFRVAATHELMHDLIQEHFPRLANAPLWVNEGICQQAAAEYCSRRNYADTLQGIKTCADPDYGDGYRYIHNIAGMQGWHALRRWMETVDVDALPEAAPK